MIQPYAVDNPEDESLSIRIYPANGSANVAAQGSSTVVSRTPSPPPTVPSSFSGPLQQQYTTTTTTTGPTMQVTTGAFARDPIELTKFLAYDYDEQYLTPADGWSFQLSLDELSDTQRQVIRPGSRVEILVSEQVQSIGYIDEVRSHGSRQSGALLTVQGRDWMAPAVDCHVDPQTRFKPSMSLVDLLTAVFTPFGMQVLAADNIANRNAITGAIYGTPTSQKKGKPLKSFVLHEIKPYPQEGAYAFASRISQRFGLWIRPAVDGQTLIVAQPDFDQPSRYTVLLKRDGSQTNNVIDWDVSASRMDQPSIIFASGYGGGGEFAHSTLRGAIINPIIAVANPNIITQLLAAYPGIVATTTPMPALLNSATISSIIAEPNARPLYLYDGESHDASQLQAFLRRELAHRLHKSLTVKYTIEGHRLGGQPVAVDTILSVDDDVSNLHDPVYILGRRLSKKPGQSGTTTTIEACRVGALQF